jgi:hypothetical protein
MSIFGNFEDYLAKLKSIEWKSADGDLVGSYTKKFVSEDDNFELSYSIETMTSLHDRNVPFRAVIYVRYKGQTVSHWGCVSNEENALFLEWWLKEQRVINDKVTKRESNERKQGEELWKNL